MPDRPLVASPVALEAFLTAASDTEVASLSLPEELLGLVTKLESPQATYLVHASDSPDSPRIVFEYKDCLERLPENPAAAATALQRALRASLQASTPPLRLPPAWSEYHHGGLIAFFATPREHSSLRWIALVGPGGTTDVLFCQLNDPSAPLPLQGFRPSLSEYRSVTSGWPGALEQAKRRFDRLKRTEAAEVVATVDLEATAYGAVVGDRSYSRWLPELTEAQRQFLERPAQTSVKLRGPAGTGKTLLLELKAMREHYAAQDGSEERRLLFVTHSWGMAEQIDAALSLLNDRPEPLDDIAVYPLLSIAQDVLPSERQGRGFDLLGEDNLSGKRLQLEAISRLVNDAVQRDWLAYEDRCSPDFTARATAKTDTPEHRAFVWDLMQEFACVLSAQGILPGVNAARSYLPLQRMPWMMPLTLDGDKLFVLAVYTALVNEMRDRHLLTSDQLINDFLNYLETFAWNLRRSEVGYDLILVDELHLFNEQERMALSFLSRDPSRHPVMLMALDPRQSPAESYTQAGVAGVTGTDSGAADDVLGRIEAVDLRTIHRFSPEILGLVRFLNQAYPALDLSEDWDLKPESWETSVASGGQLPEIIMHDDRQHELAGVAGAAADASLGRAADERVAIVVIDTLTTEQFAELSVRGANVLAIRGRDDVEAMHYSKRAVVVGAAEYLAGLQFHTVLVAGLPHAATRNANLTHERRRLLSLLYLAVSRATTRVELHVNTEYGGVPDVLTGAVEQGIAILR